MIRLCLILSLLLFPVVGNASDQADQKICLNMIVKNESRVIKRCLASVKELIDYWVVVDTGSDDGTQEIIKEYLKDIPGELHERPWRNFGENRSEAFNLAQGKGSYILFMDADDTLEFAPDFKFPPLTKDLYLMWRGTPSFTYQKPQLARGDLPWRWVGVTHEYLDLDRIYTSEILENVNYISGDGGASNDDPRKFWRNVELLTEGLKKEPNNARYAFYLAESYRDAGERAKALEWYQKRVDMGGWEEELFYSKLQIGHLLRHLGMPASLVKEAYKLSHLQRPHRIEPIYYIAETCNGQEEYEEAYRSIKAWQAAPKPSQKDILFNEDWVAHYGLLFQLSICSYYVGEYQESLNACDELLKIKELPEAWRAQVAVNRTFPAERLAEIKKNPQIYIQSTIAKLRARSTDPLNDQKDVELLLQGLKEEPNNDRYLFCLAKSYHSAGDLPNALKRYQERIGRGGWDQEVYHSMVMVGAIQEELKMDPKLVMKSYYDAYHFRPSRAEALYRLANYYRTELGDFAAGYLLATTGLKVALPQDTLFVDDWIYEWGMVMEFSMNAYSMGRYEESKRACEMVLAKEALPDPIRECAKRSLVLANDRLAGLPFNDLPLPGLNLQRPL